MPPGTTEAELGAIASEKPAAVTVRVTVAVCVSVPLVPVMVIVELPPGVVPAVVVMVRVEVPDVVIEAGENVAVAPAGRPPADRLTVELNPLSAPVVTVYVAGFPALTVDEPGDAATVKSGATAVRVTVVEFVRVPLVPFIVIVELPAGVVPAVVAMVNVELPEVLIDAGENVAVAPAGRPLADRLTEELNPFSAPIVTVYIAGVVGFAVAVVGDAVTEKFGEFTCKLTVSLCVSMPLVPVIVIVEVPAGVLALVVIVNVELPEVVTDAGANEAVAPVGKPVAARFTAPVKPLSGAIVTV